MQTTFIFRSPRTVLSLVGVIFLTACTAPVTKITGSWKDPAAKGYKDFFVVVMTKNVPARNILESDIASRLKHEHVKVTKSVTVFPHTEKVETPDEKKAAVEKIQSLGHDAIIVITLVNKSEESRYVPGTTQYTPMNVGYGTGYGEARPGVTTSQPIYGTFGTYYVGGTTTYNSPDYYTMDKAYFLQSNVYDAQTSKLVWSAQSETFNPPNINSASGDFSFVMVDALKKANLIYKKEKVGK